jgi:hypothetical protein
MRYERMPGDVAESGDSSRCQRQASPGLALSRGHSSGAAAAPITLAAIVAGALAPVEQHIAGVGQDRDAVVLFLALGQRVERGAVLAKARCTSSGEALSVRPSSS